MQMTAIFENDSTMQMSNERAQDESTNCPACFFKQGKEDGNGGYGSCFQ
jgi:hypothetical protein